MPSSVQLVRVNDQGQEMVLSDVNLPPGAEVKYNPGDEDNPLPRLVISVPDQVAVREVEVVPGSIVKVQGDVAKNTAGGVAGFDPKGEPMEPTKGQKRQAKEKSGIANEDSPTRGQTAEEQAGTETPKEAVSKGKKG